MAESRTILRDGATLTTIEASALRESGTHQSSQPLQLPAVLAEGVYELRVAVELGGNVEIGSAMFQVVSGGPCSKGIAGTAGVVNMTRTDRKNHGATRSPREIAFFSGRLAAAVIITLTATMAGGADWYALCERETGSVVVGESPEEDRYQVLAGPFPGRRTAGMWIEDHHPDHRCTAPVSGPHGNAALSADGEEWLAVCSQMTHEVELVQKAPPSGYLVLLVNNFQPTLHPDSTTARNWTDSVCPAWRCDSMGRCMTDPTANDPGAASGGWTAGSLTSVTLDSDATAAPQTSRAISMAGPGRADLSPLIDTATAAAMSCAYPAALADTDHMTTLILSTRGS